MIAIVKAIPQHCQPIALKMRLEDRNECREYGRYTPIRALKRSIEHSYFAWTALEDGVPIAMFGVCDETPISDEGIVWFLGTDDVRKYPRSFLKEGVRYIKAMLEDFEMMHNLISKHNTFALRFAKHLQRALPHQVVLTEEATGFRITITR